jgi:hypothetical protein
MQWQALLWMFLPVLVAGGSALVAYAIMQSRMEAALAKEREALAEARAIIQSHKVTLEERIRAVEEATRRATLEELMQDIRVEERSYVRDVHAPEGARRSMVLQERVFFRNLPVSGWSERELLIESGPAGSLPPRTAEERFPVSLDALRSATTPAAETRPAPAPVPAASEATGPQVIAAAPRREPRALVAVHAAFGAQ